MNVMENKYKYCFWFSKQDLLVFISHLDLMRLFGRAFLKSNMPVLYTCGFNPHPRFSLPYPLALGCVGIHELGEVFLTQKIELAEFKKKINSVLPSGIVVNEVCAQQDCPDLKKTEKIEFVYQIEIKKNFDQELLNQRLNDKEYFIERVNKKGKSIQDKVNDFIKEIEVKENKLKVILKLVDGRTLKTEQLFKFFAIGIDHQLVDISRSLVIN